MYQWCQIMIQEGGGRVGCFFSKELLEEWRHVLVVIEEYPYAGMNYHGDLEMP